MAKKSTKKAKQAKAAEAPATPQTFTLANLARELEMNPKNVRARFRKLYSADNAADLPQPVKGGSRWTYAMSDRDAIVAMLKAGDS